MREPASTRADRGVQVAAREGQVPGPSPIAQAPQAEPACPATGDGVTVLADRLESGRVTFDLYSGTVAPDSLPIVDAVAARLRGCADLQVEIQVHTDTVRMASFNARQSQRVAEVLRDRLVADGVDVSRLAACGYGESRPVSNAVDWTSRSANMRVEWHTLATPASGYVCPSVDRSP